jgi:anti-anti-sigma factor
MQITTTTKNDTTIATLAGRMDAMTTTEFDRWFAEQQAAGNNRFVLDLQGLDYISSAGLRSLLAAAKQMKARNGSLLLCGLSGTVEEVFKMSGFLTIFQSFSSVEDALQASGA